MTTLAKGKSLRLAFGETITELAETDKRLVVLDGDTGSSTYTSLFEAAYPDRFFQMGITEQNMLGMAAGMATLGLVPIVSTFSCFIVSRAHDSIRVLIAQPKANVKMMGRIRGPTRRYDRQDPLDVRRHLDHAGHGQHDRRRSRR